MPALDPLPVATSRQVQPDGTVLIVGPSIRFRVEVLKPGFALLTAAGGRSSNRADAQAEQMMLKELDRELKSAGALTVFADLRKTSRMSAESRDVASTWMRENRALLKGTHVLVGSKLLEMAFSIVGMLVGGGILKVYSQTGAFLDLVRAIKPELLELPMMDRPSVAGS